MNISDNLEIIIDIWIIAVALAVGVAIWVRLRQD